MAKRQSSTGGGWLALFTTTLVVGGVVAVSYITTPHPADPTPTATSTGDGQPVPTAQKKSASAFPPFLAIGHAGVHLISSDDSRELHSSTDFGGVDAVLLRNMPGVELTSGKEVNLDTTSGSFVTSTEIVSPDASHTVDVAARRSDATNVVVIKGIDELSRTQVLRLTNGSGVRDAQVLGWWNEHSFAVLGFATSSRAIYTVDLSGTVRLTAWLPEFVEHIGLQAGSVWYIEVTPGVGLEQPDQAPSSLHRIDVNGKDSIVADESSAVITQYVVKTLTLFVYATADGKWRLTTGTQTSSFGVGAPVLFLDDTHILIANGGSYVVRDLSDGTDRPLPGPLAQDDAVFPLPTSVIDEIQKNT